MCSTALSRSDGVFGCNLLARAAYCNNDFRTPSWRLLKLVAYHQSTVWSRISVGQLAICQRSALLVVPQFTNCHTVQLLIANNSTALAFTVFYACQSIYGLLFIDYFNFMSISSCAHWFPLDDCKKKQKNVNKQSIICFFVEKNMETSFCEKLVSIFAV